MGDVPVGEFACVRGQHPTSRKLRRIGFTNLTSTPIISSLPTTSYHTLRGPTSTPGRPYREPTWTCCPCPCKEGHSSRCWITGERRREQRTQPRVPACIVQVAAAGDTVSAAQREFPPSESLLPPLCLRDRRTSRRTRCVQPCATLIFHPGFVMLRSPRVLAATGRSGKRRSRNLLLTGIDSNNRRGCITGISNRTKPGNKLPHVELQRAGKRPLLYGRGGHEAIWHNGSRTGSSWAERRFSTSEQEHHQQERGRRGAASLSWRRQLSSTPWRAGDPTSPPAAPSGGVGGDDYPGDDSPRDSQHRPQRTVDPRRVGSRQESHQQLGLEGWASEGRGWTTKSMFLLQNCLAQPSFSCGYCLPRCQTTHLYALAQLKIASGWGWVCWA